MPRSRIAALEFTLRWQSPVVHHIERVYFDKPSFLARFLSRRTAERLGGLTVCADPLYAAWGRAA